jgi:hypothetical protein
MVAAYSMPRVYLYIARLARAHLHLPSSQLLLLLLDANPSPLSFGAMSLSFGAGVRSKSEKGDCHVIVGVIACIAVLATALLDLAAANLLASETLNVRYVLEHSSHG